MLKGFYLTHKEMPPNQSDEDAKPFSHIHENDPTRAKIIASNFRDAVSRKNDGSKIVGHLLGVESKKKKDKTRTKTKSRSQEKKSKRSKKKREVQPDEEQPGQYSRV